MSLGAGTNSPKTIEAIKERFDWYLKVQRSQRAEPAASENFQRILDQARQALDAGADQLRPEPLATDRDIRGPRL